MIAVVVTFGTGAAAPLTGGTSLTLSTISIGATFATGGACFNSLARTTNALINPGGNQKLDSMPAYRISMNVLDGVSLLGVGASALAATKVARLIKRAGVSIPQALTGDVSRQARKRLTQEAIKLKHPGLSNGAVKALIRSNAYPSRYTRDLISEGILRSLRDSVSASLSFLSSAFDGHVKQVTVYVVGLVY